MDEVLPWHRKFKPSPDEMKEYAKQGIVFKVGRFDVNEDKRIVRNWKKFSKFYNVSFDDIYDVRCRSARMRQFVKQTNMLAELCRKLPLRTVHSVYCRARVILNPKYEKQGEKYTKAEEKCVKELAAAGKTWHDIAVVLGRTPNSVGQFFSKSKSNYKRLSEMECAELFHVVKKLKNVSYDEIVNVSTDDIPWEQVKKSFAPDRSVSMLKRHWAMYRLKNKFVRTADEDRAFTKALSDSVRRNFVSSMSAMAWDKVARDLNCELTIVHLKFRQIRMKIGMSYKTNTLEEIICSLRNCDYLSNTSID